MPKVGELIDEYCHRVSDLGLPVSDDGMKVCEKLDKEYEKRDQEERGMHIYTDWNGWAMSEIMVNMVRALVFMLCMVNDADGVGTNERLQS